MKSKLRDIPAYMLVVKLVCVDVDIRKKHLSSILMPEALGWAQSQRDKC